MIGRGIRQCSHADLPMNERTVDVYRYKSVSEGITTADQYVEGQAKNKDRLITSFLDALKEAAVDCRLNYAHNMLKQDIKCFQFDEPALFGKQIGPAYKKDVMDDILMNNGSNSIGSTTMKIRVIKILASKVINDDTNTPPEKYWYYPESGVVYDYELHYPIGMIQRDESGNPVKINKDVYVIDKTIPIPLLK